MTKGAAAAVLSLQRVPTGSSSAVSCLLGALLLLSTPWLELAGSPGPGGSALPWLASAVVGTVCAAFSAGVLVTWLLAAMLDVCLSGRATAKAGCGTSETSSGKWHMAQLLPWAALLASCGMAAWPPLQQGLLLGPGSLPFVHATLLAVLQAGGASRVTSWLWTLALASTEAATTLQQLGLACCLPMAGQAAASTVGSSFGPSESGAVLEPVAPPAIASAVAQPGMGPVCMLVGDTGGGSSSASSMGVAGLHTWSAIGDAAGEHLVLWLLQLTALLCSPLLASLLRALVGASSASGRKRLGPAGAAAGASKAPHARATATRAPPPALAVPYPLVPNGTPVPGSPSQLSTPQGQYYQPTPFERLFDSDGTSVASGGDDPFRLLSSDLLHSRSFLRSSFAGTAAPSPSLSPLGTMQDAAQVPQHSPSPRGRPRATAERVAAAQRALLLLRLVDAAAWLAIAAFLVASYVLVPTSSALLSPLVVPSQGSLGEGQQLRHAFDHAAAGTFHATQAPPSQQQQQAASADAVYSEPTGHWMGQTRWLDPAALPHPNFLALCMLVACVGVGLVLVEAFAAAGLFQAPSAAPPQPATGVRGLAVTFVAKAGLLLLSPPAGLLTRLLLLLGLLISGLTLGARTQLQLPGVLAALVVSAPAVLAAGGAHHSSPHCACMTWAVGLLLPLVLYHAHERWGGCAAAVSHSFSLPASSFARSSTTSGPSGSTNRSWLGLRLGLRSLNPASSSSTPSSGALEIPPQEGASLEREAGQKLSHTGAAHLSQDLDLLASSSAAQHAVGAAGPGLQPPSWQVLHVPQLASSQPPQQHALVHAARSAPLMSGGAVVAEHGSVPVASSSTVASAAGRAQSAPAAAGVALAQPDAVVDNGEASVTPHSAAQTPSGRHAALSSLRSIPEVDEQPPQKQLLQEQQQRRSSWSSSQGGAAPAAGVAGLGFLSQLQARISHDPYLQQQLQLGWEGASQQQQHHMLQELQDAANRYDQLLSQAGGNTLSHGRRAASPCPACPLCTPAPPPPTATWPILDMAAVHGACPTQPRDAVAPGRSAGSAPAGLCHAPADLQAVQAYSAPIPQLGAQLRSVSYAYAAQPSADNTLAPPLRGPPPHLAGHRSSLPQVVPGHAASMPMQTVGHMGRSPFLQGRPSGGLSSEGRASMTLPAHLWSGSGMQSDCEALVRGGYACTSSSMSVSVHGVMGTPAPRSAAMTSPPSSLGPGMGMAGSLHTTDSMHAALRGLAGTLPGQGSASMAHGRGASPAVSPGHGSSSSAQHAPRRTRRVMSYTCLSGALAGAGPAQGPSDSRGSSRYNSSSQPLPRLPAWPQVPPPQLAASASVPMLRSHDVQAAAPVAAAHPGAAVAPRGLQGASGSHGSQAHGAAGGPSAAGMAGAHGRRWSRHWADQLNKALEQLMVHEQPASTLQPWGPGGSHAPQAMPGSASAAHAPGLPPRGSASGDLAWSSSVGRRTSSSLQSAPHGLQPGSWQSGSRGRPQPGYASSGVPGSPLHAPAAPRTQPTSPAQGGPGGPQSPGAPASASAQGPHRFIKRGPYSSLQHRQAGPPLPPLASPPSGAHHAPTGSSYQPGSGLMPACAMSAGAMPAATLDGARSLPVPAMLPAAPVPRKHLSRGFRSSGGSRGAGAGGLAPSPSFPATTRSSNASRQSTLASIPETAALFDGSDGRQWVTPADTSTGVLPPRRAASWNSRSSGMPPTSGTPAASAPNGVGAALPVAAPGVAERHSQGVLGVGVPGPAAAGVAQQQQQQQQQRQQQRIGGGPHLQGPSHASEAAQAAYAAPPGARVLGKAVSMPASRTAGLSFLASGGAAPGSSLLASGSGAHGSSSAASHAGPGTAAALSSAVLAVSGPSSSNGAMGNSMHGAATSPARPLSSSGAAGLPPVAAKLGSSPARALRFLPEGATRPGDEWQRLDRATVNSPTPGDLPSGGSPLALGWGHPPSTAQQQQQQQLAPSVSDPGSGSWAPRATLRAAAAGAEASRLGPSNDAPAAPSLECDSLPRPAESVPGPGPGKGSPAALMAAGANSHGADQPAGPAAGKGEPAALPGWQGSAAPGAGAAPARPLFSATEKLNLLRASLVGGAEPR